MESSVTGDGIRRYGRQMLLPAIGASGQHSLLSSKVLLVGAGGIGSSAALYLVAAGVSLTIVDHDRVEESNLHRQVIHDSLRAGQPKSISAASYLQQLNPSASVTPIVQQLSTENALTLFRGYDVVLDCTDNFESRYIINDACVLLGITYISGSAVGMEGQITVITPRKTACYRCLYPNPSIAEATRSCSNAGVLGTVPGLIGCLEATEAMKILLCKSAERSGQLQPLEGRQILYDAASADFFAFDLPPRNPLCAVCGDNPSIVSLSDTELFLARFRDETSCAVAAYIGEVPPEQQMSVEQLHSILEAPSSSRILILDVRSSVQFGITRLKHSTITSEVSRLSDCRKIGPGQRNLLNIPLSELRTALVAFSEEVSSVDSELQVLVLCRRGVDSSVGTRLLAEFKFPATVFNIQGGLLAWSERIDRSFAMY